MVVCLKLLCRRLSASLKRLDFNNCYVKTLNMYQELPGYSALLIKGDFWGRYWYNCCILLPHVANICPRKWKELSCYPWTNCWEATRRKSIKNRAVQFPKKTQEWIEWICQFKLAFQNHHSHLYEVTTNHLSIIYDKLSLIIRQITYQYW